MRFWIGFAVMLACMPARAHAQDSARRQCNYSSASVIDECVRAKIDSLERELQRAVARALEVLPDSARDAFLAAGTAWEEYRRRECAAVRAGSGDRPEAARVHIECGGLLAIERTSALSTMYYPSYRDTTARGGCVAYEPDTVQRLTTTPSSCSRSNPKVEPLTAQRSPLPFDSRLAAPERRPR